MAEFGKVAIVGVGLIGGSIGLALRERKLASEVIGIGRRDEALDAALTAGAIDRGTTSLAKGVDDVELVVICTPVDTVVDFALRAAEHCPQRTTITDAGSTKQQIVEAVDSGLTGRRDGPWFVGSHPLAGDHRAGVEFARAELFEGRKAVVTPTEHTHRAATLDVTRFWQSLGAGVVTMSPVEHDVAVAATSHLPHLVAYALAFATPNELLPLASSGWRDTTRIAGSDPNMWRSIFASNRQRVLDALERYGEAMAIIREALEEGDDEQLIGILERAKLTKTNRDALGD